MRIDFMGTPDFAQICLQALVEAGLDVVAAVTQPDKPRGAGISNDSAAGEGVCPGAGDFGISATDTAGRRL